MRASEDTAAVDLRAASAPMFETITKRGGRCERFDARKIVRAIAKAGEATGELGEAEARRLTVRVLTMARELFADEAPTVEGIQDVVEEVLLGSSHRATAKAYVIYRDQHTKMRELASASGLTLVEDYLARADWRVCENSNMSYSLQGLNNFVSSEISKLYWLNKIYPPEIREAHRDARMHIHDLGLLSVYCVGWDLYDLLVQGFRGAPGKAESSPPSHFRSALGQIVNFFYTLQGEAAGAQAFSSFDTLLAPFVRADGLTFDEIKRDLRGFVFNLNVPTRVGFQTPFTNLTLDLTPSANYRDTAVIIGGEPQETTYGDYAKETAMIASALFQVLAEGDAKGRVFTFPIPTVNIGRDFAWEDPALEPIWEATARYGIPYFSNFVNSDLNPEDARSMCCRLRLDTRELHHRGGGLFGANPLTGSVGVVTVNLPRLGHRADDEDELLAELAEVMDLARDSLEIKRKALERFTAGDLYPYTRHYLAAIRAQTGEYWRNHFSTIGLVGMNEACENLLGRGVGTPEGKGLALRILDFMRDRLEAYQKETGNLYNLEATPAEGAGYRMARVDKDQLEGARFAGLDPDRPMYTNSSQLPVDFTNDLFEVLDLQDELQTRYTGGTVLHVFSGEAQASPKSVKAFVRAVTHRYRLPYFTFTPTFSVCPEHGYIPGEHPVCDRCGAETEVYSRVVGYLRPVNQWNEGKQEEFARRSSFEIA